MFFKKKKPKIDSKVRFQNRQFNQKLQEARTFKRTARPIPEGGFEKFLSRIGLGSRWKQIFFALLVLGVVYVVYAPNFLSLQTIQVEGLSEADRSKVETAIQDNLNKTPFYNPQRNLFFLSKNRVREVVSNIPAVDSVEGIHKNFGQKTLTITLKSKYEKFLVRSADSVLDVYNDGALKGVAGLSRDSWVSTQNPGMLKVDLNATISGNSTESSSLQQFFSANTVEYMAKLKEATNGITGSSLAYFSIRIPQLKAQQEFLESQEQVDEQPTKEESAEGEPESSTESSVEPAPEPKEELPAVEVSLPINADELDVYFQKGSDQRRTFKVIVDTKENPEALVQRLNLLLSQTAPERYAQLSYIDMRIPSRAYVCLLNTVCNR